MYMKQRRAPYSHPNSEDKIFCTNDGEFDVLTIPEK
jgi:hypothetical protein